jgi:hypothetical protein
VITPAVRCGVDVVRYPGLVNNAMSPLSWPFMPSVEQAAGPAPGSALIKQ